jgi:activator of HSP90 ATPase
MRAGDRLRQHGAPAWRAVFACAMVTALLGPARAADIVPAQSIHQEEYIPASLARVYALLLDAKAFSTMTGRKAEIDPALGGAFSLFDGVIYGRTVAETPDRLLIQAWSDTGWPPGIYSIVRFELRPKGAGTLIVFDHTGFPLGGGEPKHLATGWYEHYWNPMRKYFAAGGK